MRDKVTRQSPQTPTFEAKGEPKQIQTEVFLLTSLTPYRWAKPTHACSPQSCLLYTHNYNFPPTLCCPIKISVLFNHWCVSAPCSSRSNLHLTHATLTNRKSCRQCLFEQLWQPPTIAERGHSISQSVQRDASAMRASANTNTRAGIVAKGQGMQGHTIQYKFTIYNILY